MFKQSATAFVCATHYNPIHCCMNHFNFHFAWDLAGAYAIVRKVYGARVA